MTGGTYGPPVIICGGILKLARVSKTETVHDFSSGERRIMIAAPGPRSAQGRRAIVEVKPGIIIAFTLLLLVSLPLIAFGPNMNETALHSAAKNDDIAAIGNLLSRGMPIDARDGGGRTPLLLATHGNKVNAARSLIAAGADVNAKDNINDSPYLYAGASGYVDILKMTLAHGADLKSTNRYGGTALIPASERGHVEAVQMLIKAGVDVDHVNKLGWTALLEAIILGNGGRQHTHIVRMLVEAGANVSLADRDGVTPLRHARKRGFSEIEKILVSAGAK